MEKAIVNFLKKYNEEHFDQSVKNLLERLSSKIVFTIKVKKASIQFLKDDKVFSALGFRQSSSYFFIEFFSKANIQDNSIIKKMRKELISNGEKIEGLINKVEIKHETDIDSNIIDWIINSYTLIMGYG